MLVSQPSVNTPLQSTLTGMLSPGASGAAVPALVTLPAPTAVAGVLVAAALLAAVVVSVVAVRTFVVGFGLGLTLVVALGSSASGVVSHPVGMVNVLTTLYLLAAVSDAFVQLRDDDVSSAQGPRATTDALGT